MPFVRAATNWFIASVIIFGGVINVGVALALLEQRHESADFTRCTAQWQDDFLVAYKARFVAAKRVSHAMDRAMKAVSDQDPEAFNAAVSHYLAVRVHQNKEWARTPLPPLPSTRCGG